MGKMIHARLDPETEEVLTSLTRALGVSESEVIRRALKKLAMLSPKHKRKIVGLGRYSSGKSDLGSDKRHLEGFGK